MRFKFYVITKTINELNSFQVCRAVFCCFSPFTLLFSLVSLSLAFVQWPRGRYCRRHIQCRGR